VKLQPSKTSRQKCSPCSETQASIGKKERNALSFPYPYPCSKILESPKALGAQEFLGRLGWWLVSAPYPNIHGFSI
jgi:hypothetical protein